jgi:hypothetical protein
MHGWLLNRNHNIDEIPIPDAVGALGALAHAAEAKLHGFRLT